MSRRILAWAEHHPDQVAWLVALGVLGAIAFGVLIWFLGRTPKRPKRWSKQPRKGAGKKRGGGAGST